MVIHKEFYDQLFLLISNVEVLIYFKVSIQNSYPVIPKCDHVQKLFLKLILELILGDIIKLFPCYNVPNKCNVKRNDFQ